MISDIKTTTQTNICFRPELDKEMLIYQMTNKLQYCISVVPYNKHLKRHRPKVHLKLLGTTILIKQKFAFFLLALSFFS